MKRVLTLLLSVALLFSSFFAYVPNTVKAEETNETEDVTEVLPQDDSDPADEVLEIDETDNTDPDDPMEELPLEPEEDETGGLRDVTALEPPALLVYEAENGDIHITYDPEAEGFDYDAAIAYLELLASDGYIWIRDEDDPTSYSQISEKVFATDKVIIPNDFLLLPGSPYLNGLHHLNFSVEGYDDAQDYEITFTKACDPAPENVSIIEDENGAFIITVEDDGKAWLAGLYEGRNENNEDIGYIVLDDSISQYPTILRNEHAFYEAFHFTLSTDEKTLTITPNTSYFSTRIKNGTYELRIYVKHFTVYEKDSFVVSHGLKDAVDPESITVKCENNQIIISCQGQGADDWLNAMMVDQIVDQRDPMNASGSEGALISGTSTEGYSFSIQNELDLLSSGDYHDVLYSLENGSIVIPESTVYSSRIAPGVYNLEFRAYMYLPVNVTANIETPIRTDIPGDLNVTFDTVKGLTVTTTKDEYLDALMLDNNAIGLNFDNMGGVQFSGSELVRNEHSVNLPINTIASHGTPEYDYIIFVRAYGYVNYRHPETMHIKAVSNGLVSSITITHPKLVTGNAIIDAEGDVEMTAGKTLQLTAHVEPANAKNKAVVWTSSDTSIATVSGGKVTAKKVTELSEVVITATAKDGSGVSDSITITVIPLATEIRIETGWGDDCTNGVLNFDVNEIDPDGGMDFWLYAYSIPEEASNDIAMASSNKKVADVNEWGEVDLTGTKGTAKITATARDGSGKKATVTINVVEPVQEINLTHTVKEVVHYVTGNATYVYVYNDIDLSAGKSFTIETEVLPATATNKKLEWSSSDESAVTVKNGKVTVNKNLEGRKEVTITANATDGSGVQGTFEVHACPLAKSIQINQLYYWDPYWHTMDIEGGTIGIDPDTSPLMNGFRLVADIDPYDANDNLKWTSSNTKIATVDEWGEVHLTGTKGTVKITATATDGSKKKATVTLNIAKLVREIYIGYETNPDMLAAGKSITLKAEVYPEDAANKKLDWYSSDTSIATVKNGKVTANKKVTETNGVMITAMAKDGSGVSYDYYINVVPITTDVRIYNDEWEDVTGKAIGIKPENVPTSFCLYTQNEPYDAIQSVTWSSSNTKFVTVDSDGYVEIKEGAKGTFKLTAKANDGSGKKAVVTLNINKLVEEITIYNPLDPVRPDGTHQLTTGNARIASGKKLTLKVDVSPSDAANKSVTWFSEDDSVATVSSSGVVTAQKVDSETRVFIYAEAKDGSGVRGRYQVRVRPLATAIVLLDENGDELPENATISVIQTQGSAYQLFVRVIPDGISSDAGWKSSNTKIATVDDRGLVTFTGVTGSVKITATAKDGTGKSASVTFQPKEEAKEIVIWHTLTGGIVETIQSAIDQFNADYEGIYHATQVSKPLSGFEESIADAVDAGNGPSLVWLYPSTAQEYVSKGKSIDFSDYLSDADYKNRVYDGVYALSTDYSDHGLHSIVLSVSAPVMFYNQTLLDKYSLEKPATWDQLYNVCQRVVNGEANEGNTIMGFGPDSVDQLFIMNLEQMNLHYVNSNNTITDWTDDEFIGRLCWWKQAQDQGYFLLKDPEGYHSGPFSNQQYLCFMGSASGYGYINPDGFDMSVGVIPQFLDGRQYLEIYPRALVGFKKDSKTDEGAALLATYFTRAENNTPIAALYAAATPFTDVATSLDYQVYCDANPTAQVVNSMLEYGYARSNSNSDIRDLFQNAVLSSMYETTTDGIRQILTTAQEQANSILH